MTTSLVASGVVGRRLEAGVGGWGGWRVVEGGGGGKGEQKKLNKGRGREKN